MCLHTSKNIQTAENDIKVWKCVVISHDDDSKWWGPQYPCKAFPFNTLIVDETPFIEPERSYLGYVEIGEGFFHSCEFQETAEFIRDEHFFLHVPYYPIICQCTIPKGTLYFHDNDHYASKAIIVHRP